MDYLFHYHPKLNWINDPNGLCYFNNKFHIYYQYNPKGNSWGNICWGHATTIDFLNYTEENIALYNDTPYDKDGCYSGNSIIIDNVLYIYYTSVLNNKQTQSVAYSSDGYKFIKYDKNPIIDTIEEARDPYVFIFNNELYMIIGANKKVLLYKAKTPFEFEYVSNLIDMDEFIECPNLINLGDKYLLKYSSMVDRLDHFIIGSFDGIRFIKEKEVSLKLPKNYYASQIFKHNNEYIIIGWIHNDNYKTDKLFNGYLSIPRIIYYENNTLKTKPYKTLEKYFKSNKLIDNDITEEY
ncbi:MAG: glycoside hydrolase family 32 protein [bacterium]|nr:glycoside hydrolase family 32 protein [bacterium]